MRVDEWTVLVGTGVRRYMERGILSWPVECSTEDSSSKIGIMVIKCGIGTNH